MKNLKNLKSTFKLMKGVAFVSLFTGVYLGKWLEAQKNKHDETIEPEQDNAEQDNSEQEKPISGRYPWGTKRDMDVNVYTFKLR